MNETRIRITQIESLLENNLYSSPQEEADLVREKRDLEYLLYCKTGEASLDIHTLEEQVLFFLSDAVMENDNVIFHAPVTLSSGRTITFGQNIVEDVLLSSGYRDDGTWNDTDIRLAFGRAILDLLEAVCE